MSNLPSKNKTFVTAVKNYATKDIEVFWYYLVFLIFFYFARNIFSRIVALLSRHSEQFFYKNYSSDKNYSASLRKKYLRPSSMRKFFKKLNQITSQLHWKFIRDSFLVLNQWTCLLTRWPYHDRFWMGYIQICQKRRKTTS